MNNLPIGVFDSGIGGLTVVKEIIKLLPNESIVYLGDTARVPYGTRSPEVVTKFALELTNFLLGKGVKCLVVACNTISAVALDKIGKVSPVPVLGVIMPVVRKAVNLTKNGKIGIIGTLGTIKSKAYEKTIKKIMPEAAVLSSACPLFVPLAEEGLHQHKATRLVAKEYLNDLVKAGVDTIILGCTHYPLLKATIKKTVGDNVNLVDSGKPTALELKSILEKDDLLSNNLNPSLEFYVTDAPERVYKVASRFFGEKLSGRLKKINLED